MHMPVFTFEKISPPLLRNPTPPSARKRRGVLVQIQRFVEARLKRATVTDKAGNQRRQKPSNP
jgi:hypothetical protein